MSSARARRRSCWARAAAQIKRLGERARLEFEKMLERKVHLFLFIKVREDWAGGPRAL
jgi:GTP-binding protein Era